MSSEARSDRSGKWRRVLRGRTLVFGLIVALAGASCRDTPASPTRTERWAGSLDDAALGRGSLEVAFNDASQQVGTWTAAVGGVQPSGSVGQAGTLPSSADTRLLFLFSCAPAPDGGTIVFTATLAGGTLHGTYLSIGCSTLTNGSLQLSRR